MLAREFSKQGYRTAVFCDCPTHGLLDGNIEYLHYSTFPTYVDHNWIDYFISSRTTDTFKLPIRAKKKYVIAHDVRLPNDNLFIDKVDKFLALSEWHKSTLSNNQGIPLNKLDVSSNGIDFSRFDNKNVERELHRLIWSSCWDRGLDNVLYLLPFLRGRFPDISLHIYYGVYNWKQSCIRNNDIMGLAKIKWLEEEIDKQPNVFLHGRVSQKELASEFLKSSLWLYPSSFPETFCITAIEAQRARVPIICHNYAGLKTTLGDSAVMLGAGDHAMWPYTKEGRESFYNATIKIFEDVNYRNDIVEKGYENSKKYSWGSVAKLWMNLFKKEG